MKTKYKVVLTTILKNRFLLGCFLAHHNRSQLAVIPNKDELHTTIWCSHKINDSTYLQYYSDVSLILSSYILVPTCRMLLMPAHASLLYLTTQIRFLIGGERVMCHWSKLNDALGRTKLNDTLGKQQLELWTRTWSCCAPWNRGKFVYRSAWCKKPLK